MIEIKIKPIIEHFEVAHYLEAYEKLNELCKDSPYNEFSVEAMSILSRFNDINNLRNNNCLAQTDYHLQKNEIARVFLILIEKIKKRFGINNGLDQYKDEAIRMEGHRDLLRESLFKIQYGGEYCDCKPEESCQCGVKRKLLKKIMSDIDKALDYVKELIKSFTSIQDIS